MSAGIGGVPAAQTYLDITQGNRVSESLYDDELPSIGFDRRRRRGGGLGGDRRAGRRRSRRAGPRAPRRLRSRKPGVGLGRASTPGPGAGWPPPTADGRIATRAGRRLQWRCPA